MKKKCENIVFLKGKLSEIKQLSDYIYTATLEVKRPSGISDFIPIQINKYRFSDLPSNCNYVKIVGLFKSLSENSSLVLYVWAKEIIPLKEEEYENEIIIKGFLSKLSATRKTPLTDKTITDFLMATNFGYNSYYLPHIAWYSTAEAIADLPLGTFMKVKGRLQSREYIKKYPDGSQEIKTAYEVSTNALFTDC